MEGNLRFKIDWASLTVGSKFTVFALFYFVFGGNFRVPPRPPGGLYLEGRFNGGFFSLLVSGAYIWRGLYMDSLIFGILRYFQSLHRDEDIYELKGVHIAAFEPHLFSSNVEHCSISNVNSYQDSCKQCCPIAVYAMCYTLINPCGYWT